jgi:pyruvate dehydrogenase E1 component alpha subunit
MNDYSRIYQKLRLIRRVEETITDIYPSDKIKSPVHLSIGQESVSVGVCDVLRDDDVVAPTYRCHAAYLAKGGDLNRMMAELFGKDAGCARGKGGSMHLVDMEHHILGASAVVGTTIPIAVGYSLALKREDQGRVAVAFFGDGGTEEGVFHESLNFAALHRLPVLFVCENNFYAIHTPIEKRWATKRLGERVKTYGIPVQVVEDSDVMAIRSATAGAIDAMRAQPGPAFLELHTYRWREHVGPGEDYNAGYRNRDELKKWQQVDQLAVIGAFLDAERRERIDSEVESAIQAAVAFAEEAAWPAVEELFTHVYAE